MKSIANYFLKLWKGIFPPPPWNLDHVTMNGNNIESTAAGTAAAFAKHIPSGSKQRCPHDGGYCHHTCITECFRIKIGASLSTPWEGFPKEGTAPIKDIK